MGQYLYRESKVEGIVYNREGKIRELLYRERKLGGHLYTRKGRLWQYLAGSLGQCLHRERKEGVFTQEGETVVM